MDQTQEDTHRRSRRQDTCCKSHSVSETALNVVLGLHAASSRTSRCHLRILYWRPRKHADVLLSISSEQALRLSHLQIYHGSETSPMPEVANRNCTCCHPVSPTSKCREIAVTLRLILQHRGPLTRYTMMQKRTLAFHKTNLQATSINSLKHLFAEMAIAELQVSRQRRSCYQAA